MKIRLGKLKQVIRESIATLDQLKEFDVGYVEDPRKMQTSHDDFENDAMELYKAAIDRADTIFGDFDEDGMSESMRDRWLQEASDYIDENADGDQQRKTCLNWLTSDYGATQR